jgi:hypothetical protein
LKGPLLEDVAADEMDGGIPLPHWLKLIKLGEAFHRDFIEADFSIETQGGLQLIAIESGAGELVEAVPKSIEVGGQEGDTGGHGMAAVTNQQIATLTQSGGQVEARDAAARSSPFGSITADDDAGAVKLLEDTGGHDAYHADVPGHLTFDDNEIGFGFKFGSDGGDGLVSHAALDGLSLTVAGIQILSDGAGGGMVGSEEEIERIFSSFQTAGGVEAGSELKADFVSAEHGRGLGDAFQREQSRAVGGV